METIAEDDVIAEIPVASCTKEQAKTWRCLESCRKDPVQPCAGAGIGLAPSQTQTKRDRLRGLWALCFLAWPGELGVVCKRAAMIAYFPAAAIIAYLPKDSDRRGRDERDRGDRNLNQD